MNRPIKFRAWDEKNDIMRDWQDISHEWTMWQLNEPIQAVFMQFTGLLDKNGREIYEGDICQIQTENTPHTAIVEFFEGSFCFKLSKYLLTVDELNRWRETTEIIGNAYENPDLLK